MGLPYGRGPGLSIIITGAKVGVGPRQYFNPGRKVSTFVVGNLEQLAG